MNNTNQQQQSRAEIEFRQSADQYIAQLMDGHNGLLPDLLREHLSQSGKSTDWIDDVLQHIHIRVEPNCLQPPIQNGQASHVTTDAQRQKSPVLYMVDGEGPYGVGHAAYHIVKLIAASQTQMSFYELQKAVYTHKGDNIKFLKDIENHRSSGDTHKRWFEEYPLTGKDGIPFAVSNQWTRDTIIPLVEIGRKFGLDIRKI